MKLSWLPNTTQGRMAGDYISTSFVGSTPIPVFTTALAPTGTTFAQTMTAGQGLSVQAGFAATDATALNPHAQNSTAIPRAFSHR